MRRERDSNQGGSARSKVSAARLVAYDVLRDVDEREAYANLSLPSRIRAARLDSRDAGLATELASGTLRHRGRYDRIIELASNRSIAAIDGRTLRVLRLGAHQLLAMRTPTHAAVNESVELQRRVANKAAAGFVNAVLRTIARTTLDEWINQIRESAASVDEALSAVSSHPIWIVRALRDALRAEGRETELQALLDADNVAPRVSLALLPGAPLERSVAEALSEQPDGVGVLESRGPSPLGFELASGDPTAVIENLTIEPGMLRVQDQGSQLAALALTRVRDVIAGERWLDLCAGPGGKTAILGAEAGLRGARVRANEVAPHRADLVRQAVEASEDVVDVVSHDGRDADAYETGVEYDRILVDAPCSGLGALRRRPEARWRKQPSDLPGLTSLQSQLLEQAVAHLARGGVLAYVTCSPHRAETRIVLDGLLSRHNDLREIDAKAVLESIASEPLDLAGDTLSAQLWPHRNGTDAMFIALIERVPRQVADSAR